MKKMLNTLARRSFAASRVRNLIAVVAIALTTVLFTAVTTIGMGTAQSITLTMQMLKGSRSDGDFRYMTARQFEALQQADFVQQAGLRMPVDFLTNTTRHNVELDVADEVQANLTFCAPTHGTMPRAANEVVASDKALRDLGAEVRVGAEVTIEFTAHGREYSLPMTVSGWYEAGNDQLSVMVVGTAFRDAHPDIFEYTFDRDRSMAGTYFSDFLARSSVGLEEKMYAFARSVGGDPENGNAPNSLPAVVNQMTHQPVDLKLVAMGAAFVALFAFCGYLLIYNVFDIAVMQEIRRYGLYRTIGMSKKQVKRLIDRQALWLACLGIPLGLAVGFFIGKGTLPVVMNILSSQYENIAAEVSPSPVIFLAAALLAALTVFLSTRKPVRAAAAIPPIEAFRYVESGTGKRASRKSALGADLPRLAWQNLGRSKRRTAFIMISIMLCVVLLNCVGIAAASLDVEKQVAYMIRTDFSVVNAASTNGRKGFSLREHALRQETIEAIAAQPGVTGGSVVYKNTAEDTDVTYDFGLELTGETFVHELTGLTFGATAEYEWFGLGADGRPVCNVYGMEEAALARMDLRQGETDPHALYEKMAAGQGVLVGVGVVRTDMSLLADQDFVEVGDIITVYKNGRPVMELPVLAKAALVGDDEEIGYTCNGPMVVGGDGLFLYLPAGVYETLYDQPTPYKYGFDVKEGQEAGMTAFLENYIQQQDPSMNYLSAEFARKSSEATRTTIRFVGGLVGLIFGIAGVLNLVNTIVTTILTRRHEFATMQSIGMTRRQLTKMMVFEGLYYALGGCLLGLGAAAALGFTLLRGMLAGMWQYTFQFTLLPALAVSAVLLVLAALVPALALRVFHRGSIVEQLRAAE